jgi:hypothetical protein
MKITVHQIESGIPLPDPYPTANGLPLRQLAVGDSILFNAADRAKVQSQASWLRRRYKLVFSIRKQDQTTSRIWRVK